MLIKTPLLHQRFGPCVFLFFFLFLSFFLSLYFWLIPWNSKASCITQGILASSLLSLSHRRLQTTRFRSIKGPTLLVRLPSEFWKPPADLPVRGFPGVWKLPLLILPSRDRSLSLTLSSFFLSSIFCPTSFWRQWAVFLGAWCPLPAFRSFFVEFVQCSNVLLMNLWGRKWSSHPIPLPS